MITYLENIGEYFAANFFDNDFDKTVNTRSGYDKETREGHRKAMAALGKHYYDYKAAYQRPQNRRTKDQIVTTHRWHNRLLAALDYQMEGQRYTFVDTGDEGVVPVRQVYRSGDGSPQLFVMEMRSLLPREDQPEPEGLFEQRYTQDDWRGVFSLADEQRLTPSVVNEAISKIFLLEEARRPEYILLLAGSAVFLLHYAKWSRGSYLRFDLERLFETGAAKKQDYATFYALLCRASLAPDGALALVDQLNEDSHKKAQAVTQDLKEGVVLAVEALANEALRWYAQPENHPPEPTATVTKPALPTTAAPAASPLDPDLLTKDCLTLVYRLLFLFYAESREELRLLPLDDQDYKRGYSLEMLRDLEQTRLQGDHALNGYFFDDSLRRLFNLLFAGYRGSFTVKRLDSPLFDDGRLHYFGAVRVRNRVWQQIIQRLSLSKRQGRGQRGRISYANLDINQLGSVYESLLSYRGILAREALIEVHKKNKPAEGTYLTPRSRMDEFDFKTEVLRERDPEGHETDRPLVHPPRHLRVPPQRSRPRKIRQLLHPRGAHPDGGALHPGGLPPAAARRGNGGPRPDGPQGAGARHGRRRLPQRGDQPAQ
jgi:hypothetical protein